MNKAQINYVLTIIMIVLGIIVLVTGLMLWYSHNVIKGQYRGAASHPYREIVRTIHLYTALILFGVCVIHFVLNINWFIAMSKRKR
ncbi:MAG: DUF4405 domain-containing protein [Crenarchaeota archaeon]|nr:DUF4405 domain-containing protein [Thermoproteota archaeon]